MLADVNSYKSFYNIDGIFLDEMHNISDTLSYYQLLRTGISSINASYTVFGNASTSTLEAYTSTADVLVTFENQTGYNTFIPDAWTANYSANRYAHLLYNVGTVTDMQTDLALAVSRNVGYIYITNDSNFNNLGVQGNSPWVTLPSYWNAEVSAISAVPEPESAWLFWAGLGLLGLQFKRSSLQS